MVWLGKFDHSRRMVVHKGPTGRKYFTSDVAATIVTRPRGVERQNGPSFCVLRPMPNPMTVLVDFPDSVKGHTMAPAIRIHEPERLRVVFGENHLLKRDEYDPALDTIEITQLETPPSKFRVPPDAVQ